MLRARRSALERLIRRSLADGLLRRRFFEEVMIHLSLVLGFPHMLQGMEVLWSASAPARGRLRREKGSRGLRAKGMEQFHRVYGPQTGRVLSFLDSLKRGLSIWILENVYGRVYARPGLSLAEREVLTIVVLNYHRHTKQLTAHLRGALRSGLSREELHRLFVRLRARYGMQTRKALALVDQMQERSGPSPRRTGT